MPSTVSPPTKLSFKARSHVSRAAVDASSRQNTTDHQVLRADRLDYLEAAKSKIWKNDLRLSELAYFTLLIPALAAMWWFKWSWPVCLIASVYAVIGMLAFSTWMVPRERRLIRHMMFLARHRRRCIDCRYVIQDVERHLCPECGKAFNPQDQRHLMLPLINQLYSQQARRIAAVAIPMMLVEITLIAGGASVALHTAAAAGFLLAFHCVFGLTYWEARRDTSTGRPWSSLRQMLAATGFSRLLRLQYSGLLLRWAFLVSLCGGLAAILQINVATLERLGIANTPFGVYGGIGTPALVWLGLVIFGYRHLMVTLHSRMRRLLLSA